MDIQAARARCEAATLEPWAIDGLNRLFIVAPKRPKHGIITDFGPRAKGHPEREANAEFIAHARSDLPAALERIRELEETVKIQDTTQALLVEQKQGFVEALEEAQGERDVARERAYVLAESLHRHHSDERPPCDRCSPTMRAAILRESE